MAKPKPCKKEGCDEPKNLPAHFCYWHDLERAFIDDQVVAAKKRREHALTQLGGVEPRATVPAREWPAGHRWCSGCQSFVPLWYANGKSRCRACDSAASYGSHIQKEYGISYGQYLAMYEYQNGRCYICQKRPQTIRLAVDHDHLSGRVRGLLCTGQRSCNHDVLGNIKDLAMAERIVEYLLRPPASQVLTDSPGIKVAKVSRDPYKYPDGDWLRWPPEEARYAATGAADAWSLERALPDALSCTYEVMKTIVAKRRLESGLYPIPEDEWVRLLQAAKDRELTDQDFEDTPGAFGKWDDSGATGTGEFPEQSEGDSTATFNNVDERPQEPISGPEPADWRNDPDWS